MNDDFLNKCRSLDPSADIDRERNREIIKSRLSAEEDVMFKSKRVRRPLLVAAVLAGILSVSAVVYAAAPAIFRYFDTRIVEGEEFVHDFWMFDVALTDGTRARGGGIDIDREALEAAGGGAVIVEVYGEEWVMLDELHLDNMADGLALLEVDSPLLPSSLPAGFAFERFTFHVNPNNHRYMSGDMVAAKNAFIQFSDGDGGIRLEIRHMGDTYIMAIDDQQSLLINGNKAVLSGILTNNELSMLEGVALYDLPPRWEGGSFGMTNAPGYDRAFIMILSDGFLYIISSEDVSLFDLAAMAASME